MDKLDQLQKKIDSFNKERDWDKFHSPANLAKSISIEAGELLECFQWDEKNFDSESVKEELADVLLYSLQMANALELDPIKICEEKMKKNGEKYPVDKSKGNAIKYTKF